MRRAFLPLPLLLLAMACGTGEAGEPARDVERVAAADLPAILVYKSPSCGCCNGWVAHLEAAGFAVETRDVQDIMSVKQDAGVPAAMSSCHTAIVDGYVVEGHVPAEHVVRMLEERPDFAGIAVPGMPIGSPGMEGSNPTPYQVLHFASDGTSGVWADVDPR